MTADKRTPHTDAKPRTKSKKTMPVRVVEQVEGEVPVIDWTIPSPHYLKLDKARLDYWRAKIAKQDLVAPLKVWADLLHIPRKKSMSRGVVTFNASVVIQRFERAVRADEMRGAQPPEDRQAIEKELEEAREDLEFLTKKLFLHKPIKS